MNELKTEGLPYGGHVNFELHLFVLEMQTENRTRFYFLLNYLSNLFGNQFCHDIATRKITACNTYRPFASIVQGNDLVHCQRIFATRYVMDQSGPPMNTLDSRYQSVVTIMVHTHNTKLLSVHDNI